MTEDEWEAFFDESKAKELIWYAEGNDHQPLVEHLQNGGEIGPILRDFYIRLLRGEVKKRGGTPPVKKNRDRNSDIAMQIWMTARFGNNGEGMTVYKAQKQFLSRNPNMKWDTLRTICKDWDVTAKSVRNQ